MDKRELREEPVPCTILKPVPEEPPSPPSTVDPDTPYPEDPDSPSQLPQEERRVTFDIGDSDDGDNKEGKESENGNVNGKCESWGGYGCLGKVRKLDNFFFIK